MFGCPWLQNVRCPVLCYGACYLWSLGLCSPHAVGAVDDGVLWDLLTCVEPTTRTDDAAACQAHVTAYIG